MVFFGLPIISFEIGSLSYKQLFLFLYDMFR